MNLGQHRTNPASGWSGELNPGPLDCESDVLTTQSHWLQGWRCKTRAKSFCQNRSTCSLQGGDFSRFARC